MLHRILKEGHHQVMEPCTIWWTARSLSPVTLIFQISEYGLTSLPAHVDRRRYNISMYNCSLCSGTLYLCLTSMASANTPSRPLVAPLHAEASCTKSTCGRRQTELCLFGLWADCTALGSLAVNAQRLDDTEGYGAERHIPLTHTCVKYTGNVIVIEIQFFFSDISLPYRQFVSFK